jgi:hypothetical protein
MSPGKGIVAFALFLDIEMLDPPNLIAPGALRTVGVHNMVIWAKIALLLS